MLPLLDLIIILDIIELLEFLLFFNRQHISTYSGC